MKFRPGEIACMYAIPSLRVKVTQCRVVNGVETMEYHWLRDRSKAPQESDVSKFEPLQASLDKHGIQLTEAEDGTRLTFESIGVMTDKIHNRDATVFEGLTSSVPVHELMFPIDDTLLTREEFAAFWWNAKTEETKVSLVQTRANYRRDTGRDFPPVYRYRIEVRAEPLDEEGAMEFWRRKREGDGL